MYFSHNKLNFLGEFFKKHCLLIYTAINQGVKSQMKILNILDSMIYFHVQYR